MLENVEEQSVVIVPVDVNVRVLNFSIDLITRMLLIALVMQLFMLTGLQRIVVWLDTGDAIEKSLKEFPIDFIVTFLYYILFETFWQRTPAKFITKSYVVRTDGNLPTFKDIFLRTLIRFVPFELFSFMGRQPFGWHDKWSGTRVVKYD